MAGSLALAGWWLYSHYEIKKVETKHTAPIAPIRPTGKFPVGENSEGGAWFVETDSVKGPKNQRIGWVTIEPKKPNQRLIKTLYQVNCQTSEYRILSLLGYDAKGGVTYEQSTAPDKAPPNFSPPGSLGGGVVDVLCLEGFGP